jgi:hypothetical protein
LSKTFRYIQIKLRHDKTKAHFGFFPQKRRSHDHENLRRHTSQTLILTIVLAAVLAVMGCNDSSSSSSAKAKSFESDEALTSYLKEQYASSAIPTPVRYYMMENAAPDTDAGADKGFSTTNLQEAGVDESDMVKQTASTVYRKRLGCANRICNTRPIHERGRLCESRRMD